MWPVKWNGPFSLWPWLMSQLTGRTRLQSAVMEHFSTKLLAALELQQVGERFALIFEPLLKSRLDPIASELNTTIQALSAKINTLENDAKAKDEKIAKLEQRIIHLVIIDDLEQHGRHVFSGFSGCLKMIQAPWMRKSSSSAMCQWSCTPIADRWYCRISSGWRAEASSAGRQCRAFAPTPAPG